MDLVDQEGQITVSEINIGVSRKNGKYTAIQACYTWKTQQDFDRLMRFAKRYAKDNDLTFQESKNN